MSIPRGGRAGGGDGKAVRRSKTGGKKKVCLLNGHRGYDVKGKPVREWKAGEWQEAERGKGRGRK